MRQLLEAQRTWLASIGIEATATSPAAVREYRCPSAYYSPPQGRLFLAHLHGRSVGIVGVRRLRTDCAELKRLFVLPVGRGHGVGARLVAAALAGGRDLGCRRMVLETKPGPMDVAVSIYRAAGFRPIDAYSILPDLVPGVLSMGVELAAEPNGGGLTPVEDSPSGEADAADRGRPGTGAGAPGLGVIPRLGGATRHRAGRR